MKFNKIAITALLCLFIAFSSCNNGPKVISAKSDTESKTTPSGIFSEDNDQNLNMSNQTGGSFTDNLHTVVAKEVLPTDKYVYIKVTENGKDFWIAAMKQEIDLGKVYYYRNDLLKTNFESKEYNRVFDTIYLVSNLVSHNHGAGNLKADFSETPSTTAETTQKKDIPTHTEEIIEHKGSIKIADLVADPKKYEGKTVQITGKCVKINPNIMDRNWIHLKDGSKDDYDLVVTSSTFIPEGQTVTMKAQVSLNRDFGAGYAYNLILENGIVVK